MADIKIGDKVKVIRKDWPFSEALDYRSSTGKLGTITQSNNGDYGVMIDGKLLEFYKDEIEVQNG